MTYGNSPMGVPEGSYPPGGPPNGQEYYPPQQQYGPPEQQGRNVPDQQVMYQLVPDHHGALFGPSALDNLTLGQAFQGTSFFVDYGLMGMKRPGPSLLGAPLASVADPSKPFSVTLPNGKTERAVIPTTAFVRLRQIDSVRAGVTVPFSFGALEGNLLSTRQVTDGFESLIFDNRRFVGATGTLDDGQRTPIDQLSPQAPVFSFFGTSLLNNGIPSSQVILYDHGFAVQYSARHVASDLSMLFNVNVPQEGLRVQALAGYKQVQHRELMSQIGQFDGTSLLGSPDPTDPTVIFVDPTTYRIFNPPLTNLIRTTVKNNLYGGHVGFRTEYARPAFTIGVDNRLGAAADQYSTVVETFNLRETLLPLTPVVDDPPIAAGTQGTLSRIKHTKVTPTYDMRAYTKFHISESFNINLGYNFSYIHRLARADQSIYYNDLGIVDGAGVAIPPALAAKPSSRPFWMQGWTIGCEYILP